MHFMMKELANRRGAITLLTGTALTVTTLLTGASAEAASASIGAGRVQLCSQGNYSSFLGFTPTDGSPSSRTVNVAAGSCQTFDINGNYQVTISVYGKYNTSDSTFQIGSSFTVPGTGGGWKVFTQGTTANAGAGAWWVFG